MNKVNSEEKERWQSPVVIKETAPPLQKSPTKTFRPKCLRLQVVLSIHGGGIPTCQTLPETTPSSLYD